jgi:hypothetical protein
MPPKNAYRAEIEQVSKQILALYELGLDGCQISETLHLPSKRVQRHISTLRHEKKIKTKNTYQQRVLLGVKMVLAGKKATEIAQHFKVSYQVGYGILKASEALIKKSGKK